MIVTETSADGLKREFKVIVDKRDIESRFDDRLDELRKTARIPGFRPGKVPVALLRKRYGGSIRGEILQDAVTQTSAQVFAEKEVRPAIQPKIEVIKFDDGDDLEYTMAVELLPEIVPRDFREIKLARQVAEVTDDEVSSALERIAAQERKFVPVEEDRAATKGDALVIDFVGKIDGVPFEGGKGADHVLELGSNTFVESFEEQLIGAKPGDHREVSLTFPAEYVNEELAGKDAVFDVDVKGIQRVEPVAVDDALAQRHGFADCSAMRATVREQVDRDHRAFSRAKLKRALLDTLAKDYDFQVPETMVEAEFDAIWKQVVEARGHDQTDPSDTGRSEDKLRQEYRAIAERRVRLGLLLSEVGQLNGITVGQDEISRAVAERARAMPGNEDKVVAYYRNNSEAVNALRAPLLEDKVVDFIVEMADVAVETVPAEDLMRASDAPLLATDAGREAAEKAAQPE